MEDAVRTQEDGREAGGNFRIEEADHIEDKIQHHDAC